MKIKSLAHVCLKTDDLDKTENFYCGALGMQKVFSFTKSGEVIGFYMKAANTTFIEVFRSDVIEPLGKQTLSHFCLETEDIQSLRQSLIEKDYTPGDIHLGADNAWQFWMTDPNGLSFEFHQYTPESAQFTGENVEVNW